MKEITTDLLTIRQFVQKHKFISEAGLRWRIFKNPEGLEDCLLRLGCKILIKESMFFEFLEKESQKKKEKIKERKEERKKKGNG